MPLVKETTSPLNAVSYACTACTIRIVTTGNY